MKLALAPNPILIKELRGRMRGARAFLFLTAVLLLLGAVTYGLYRIFVGATQNYGGVTPGALIGQGIFLGLVFLTVGIVYAMAPALTASAISGEQERRTYDLLMATPLSPVSIMWGKLLAALSYVVLILLAVTPFISLAYVFGGITLEDVGRTLLMFLVFAPAFAVIGLFFSSLTKRTWLAVAASYILLAFFVFGSTFIYILTAVIQNQQPPNWLLALNPFSAMSSMLVETGSLGIDAASGNASGMVLDNSFAMAGPLARMLAVFAGGSFDTGAPSPVPLWEYSVIFYVFMSIVLFFLSTQLIKPVGRFRLKPRRWALAILFVLAYGAGAYAYLHTAAPMLRVVNAGNNGIQGGVQFMGGVRVMQAPAVPVPPPAIDVMPVPAPSK